MADSYPRYFPPDFQDYLKAQHYSFNSDRDLVFFCNHHTTNSEIHDKIKALFSNLPPWILLCQFWRAVEREGRCLLTTRNQPFRLAYVNEKICQYRMAREGYEFDVKNEEGLGIPGRVFRNRSIESTPNVEYYTIQEHPLRDLALDCRFSGSVAFPVFERAFSICVGVIEVAYCRNDCLDEYPSFYEKLKEMGLEAPKPHPVNQVVNEELKEALRETCKIPDVYMAQAWEPCCACDIVFNADTNMGVVLQEEKSHIPYHLDLLHKASPFHHLRKGQGVTGRALLHNKLSFCADIKQFVITDWPFAHYAREEANQIGSLAICLQSSHIGNNVHVLEYFFYYFEDSGQLLLNILEGIKKYLPSFKLASGQTLGEELPIVTIDSDKNEIHSFLQISKETEEMQQPCVDAMINGRNEAIQEETNLLSSYSQQVGVIETTLREQRGTGVPVMVPNMDGLATTQVQNAGEVEPLVDTINTMVNDDYQEQQGILNSSSQQIETAKTVRRQHRKSGIPISLEEIQRQSGKKLEDAAESLGVSRSTMKRACREYGITWWRSGKRNKDPCASHGASIQDVAQDQIPSSSVRPTSNPPHQSPVAIDASRMKNCVPLEGIDIKVMYSDKSAIKFKLSLSSGIVELQQQVSKRLNGIDFENYGIQYKDEDNDWILIGCDDDLQDYLNSSISSRKIPVTIYLKRSNMFI